MPIVLKNGKSLILEWTSLILEYLELYEGGLEGLKRDIQHNNRQIYIANHIIYAVIVANLNEKLTPREAISLVDVNDIEKIINWVKDNADNMITKQQYNNSIQNH